MDGPLSDAAREGRRKIWRWAGLIAVGGFLFGYDTGVVSGALLFFKQDFHLDRFQQGSVVSVLLLGAIAGALGVSRVSDRWGRRMTLGLEGVVFLVGTVVLVTAQGYAMMLVGRFVLGLAVGAASATVPVYLSEISPASIRGRVLTVNQLLLTAGILVAYGVNLAFSSSGNWRAMFAAGGIPALVLAIGSLRLPESPAWQLAHGQGDRARAMIASVAGESRADEVVERFESTRRSLQQEDDSQRGRSVLLSARVRPALAVGLTLAALQQFGGINTIIYYAPTIIQETGLSASNSIFYSVAIGAINLIMTIVAIRLVDRLGRRPLLLFSLAVMMVMLALLGLTFVAGLGSVLPVVFMVLYIAAFAAGLGPVFWVLIGEIFPASAHAAGSSASTAVNWTSNFVVSLFFLPVVGLIGQGETFWVFAVVCLLGLMFVLRYVPETRNRDFAEIDAELQARAGRRPVSRTSQ
ncbi:sugar porter family MFS transporter [Actinopolymorpha singaporensis]